MTVIPPFFMSRDIPFHPEIKCPYYFPHFLYGETGEQFISFFSVATNFKTPSQFSEAEKKYTRISFLGHSIAFQTATPSSLFNGTFLAQFISFKFLGEKPYPVG